MQRILVAAGIAGLTTIALPMAALAGVIRDDVADSSYTALASSYTSVGQIYGSDAGGSFAASGVVIDKYWVLTAAHVTSGATALSFYYGDNGGSWGSFATRDHVDAVNWYSYSKWTGSLGNGYDIGLMQFDVDLTSLSGVSIANRYTGTSELGRVGTQVGYGTTGTGLTGATTFDGQKRAGENMIDAVALTPGGTNRILLADFDNPDDAADSSYGASTPLPLEYMIAPGDSGGGLFIDVGGIDYLAGITSFGWGRLDGDPNSDYGDVAGFTRVTYFNAWIDSIIGGGSGGKGGGKGGGGKPKGGNAFDLTAAQVEVPEPAALLLLVAPLAALLGRRRRAQLSA